MNESNLKHTVGKTAYIPSDKTVTINDEKYKMFSANESHYHDIKSTLDVFSGHHTQSINVVASDCSVTGTDFYLVYKHHTENIRLLAAKHFKDKNKQPTTFENLTDKSSSPSKSMAKKKNKEQVNPQLVESEPDTQSIDEAEFAHLYLNPNMCYTHTANFDGKLHTLEQIGFQQQSECRFIKDIPSSDISHCAPLHIFVKDKIANNISLSFRIEIDSNPKVVGINSKKAY